MILQNFAQGRWVEGSGGYRSLRDSVTGKEIAKTSSEGLNFEAMLDYARSVGGPNLRTYGFHDRAYMLKALASYLMERKEELYELSYSTGATRKDSWIDIEGGFGTLFFASSKARRDMPDGPVHIEGGLETLSRGGTFMGQHIAVPLRGVAIHINAYNFPIWGALEKFGPAFIAGVPIIIKPATVGSYLTEAMVKMMDASGILPEGSVQLILGSTGDLLDHVGCQDVISFTGSARTASMLRSAPTITQNSTRFIAEQDSLNGCVLGPDAGPDTPEFDLFIKEIASEISVKAGQKCTAIRRALVPVQHMDAAVKALSERLDSIAVGDPRDKQTRMGALAGLSQRQDVLDQLEILSAENPIVIGNKDKFASGDGAFLPPIIMRCDDPMNKSAVHAVEAFGPVSTLMAYDGTEEAVSLLQKGGGSLVASVFSYDREFTRDLVLGGAAFHGRMLLADRDSAKESTGHGSPLPHLVHGGPGRAGGGEEMGGTRGVMHYMQRTAIQGSPTAIANITGEWIPGAPEVEAKQHPFRRTYHQLSVGETLHTKSRKVTVEEIELFANSTGDKFYAHMNPDAASANPFFEDRVAHGYLLLSWAAGLFVEPAPGPVLANTGLNNLAFMTPVYAGDEIKVRLTVRRKKRRTEDYGEVGWDVELTNQKDEICARYELLTMVAFEDPYA
ncbi:MAG TPA: phenylacetic acid degradation bifunctional protein PaaZ [Hellea balneolensis]|uniref:Phenylacetic acid degradation bifunctional protein PaaZ n=1 Tax=Hellea balneolensis TaxID=287478 RepID=A0A7C3FYW9_9PROT|nr:phenylacetic acid degradation bifunctional protein PaaZ [Hellea balneolensis]